MKKQLQLEGGTAKKLYKTADTEFKIMLEETFGKEFFKESITDRINTIKDVLDINGVRYEDVVPYLNPKNKKERSRNAFCLLQEITEAYNEGERLDWGNTSQRKYYIWWEKVLRVDWVVDGYYYCNSGANLGSGLYFVSEEKARDAAAKFKHIYIDYLPE